MGKNTLWTAKQPINKCAKFKQLSHWPMGVSYSGLCSLEPSVSLLHNLQDAEWKHAHAKQKANLKLSIISSVKRLQIVIAGCKPVKGVCNSFEGKGSIWIEMGMQTYKQIQHNSGLLEYLVGHQTHLVLWSLCSCQVITAYQNHGFLILNHGLLRF